jgi:hypothetical protein
MASGSGSTPAGDRTLPSPSSVYTHASHLYSYKATVLYLDRSALDDPSILSIPAQAAAGQGGGCAPVAAHGPNGGAVGSGGEEGEHHAQDVRMDAPTTRPPRAPCRILAYSGSSGGVPSDTSPANKKTPALLQTTTGDETPVGTL